MIFFIYYFLFLKWSLNFVMNMGIIGKFNVYVFKKFERLYNLKFGGYVNVVLFKGFVGFCVFFCV